MKAITTKYVGPSNTKASYIKAFIDDGKVSIKFPYDYELSDEDLHRAAASHLASKLLWGGSGMVTGGIKDGYVHIITQ